MQACLDVCVAPSNADRGDAAQAAFDRTISHYRREIPDLLEFKASSVAPWFGQQTVDHTQRHLNPTRCSRHCSMPQRSADFSQRPPAQMETRNPNSPLPTNSSHDTGSPSKHMSKSRKASRWPHRQSHQPLGPSTPARWRRQR